jgi:hypothetical protein
MTSSETSSCNSAAVRQWLIRTFVLIHPAERDFRLGESIFRVGCARDAQNENH